MCPKQRDTNRQQYEIRIVALFQQPYFPVLCHFHGLEDKSDLGSGASRKSVTRMCSFHTPACRLKYIVRANAGRHSARPLMSRALLSIFVCAVSAMCAASEKRCLGKEWGLISEVGSKVSVPLSL